MEVLAVSRSNPQWLDINGQRVWSSIVRAPLTSHEDSIVLDPATGITGNKTAAHDGQVYAFFAHHYDYWADNLGVSRHDWAWCHWGENITLRCDPGLSEKDIHLGDVWEIGPDVLLQVCGSRVPCFKLSWRCGQKDKWLQELAATGKCGIYLKVLRGGAVRPGDATILKRRRKGMQAIDCATITRLAFDQSMSTKDTMDLLADDPDLLNMNKLLFRRKLSMLHDQSLHRKNAWRGWRSVRVTRVERESPDVKSFYFGTEENDERLLAAYLPGQFLTVRLPTGLSRCWSISAYPPEDTRANPACYRISVKRAGVASQWMHDECTVGTLLQIQSPSGAFCLDWSPQFPGRQVYISAGIGITPMLAMLQAHLQHPAMKRAPAVWIHVSRTAETVLFREELESLMKTPAARTGVDLQAFLFLSGGSSTIEVVPPKPLTTNSQATAFSKDIPTNDSDSHATITIYSGRPTLEILSEILADPYFIDPLQITPIEVEGKYSTVYICGPATFETATREHLAAIGIPDAMVLSEAFGSQPLEKSSLDEAQVLFARSGRLVDWKRGIAPVRTTAADGDPSDCQEGTDGLFVSGSDNENEGNGNDDAVLGPSILEIAEQAGLAPDYGCRVGSCGSCEVRLKRGKVAGGLQLGGTVRVCVARPASERVEVDM